MSVNITIRQLRKTAAQWTSDNTVLGAGVLGFETDTAKYKIGDGNTAWNSLSYPSFGGGSTWGSITGTLSDQTDLQTALNNKYDASNPAGYITGISWGSITGTLSSQTDLQSALGLKANLAGASFTGAVSVTTSGAGDTLQLTNSGSGTTLNILNSGSGDFFTVDSTKFVIDNGGDVSIGTAAALARFHVLTGATSKIGAIIQAAAGQTADLFQTRLSNGNTGMVIKSSGTQIVIGEAFSTSLGASQITCYTNGVAIAFGASTSDAVYIGKNYMQRIGAANTFEFYGSASVVATIASNKWNVAASASGGARFNWVAGVAPSSPVDGDMWRIGDVLYLRDGATTKSITFT